MKNMLDEEELIIQNMADFLKTFGEYSRIRIMECIMDIKYTVSDIADFTGISASAVSHHLKILKKEKLVVATRGGKNVYYIVSDKHVKEIYNMARLHITEFKKDIKPKDEDKEMAEIFWNEVM